MSSTGTSPTKGLICTVCKKTAKTPHAVFCCGAIYCHMCLVRQMTSAHHKQEAATCMTCLNRFVQRPTEGKQKVNETVKAGKRAYPKEDSEGPPQKSVTRTKKSPLDNSTRLAQLLAAQREKMVLAQSVARRQLLPGLIRSAANERLPLGPIISAPSLLSKKSGLFTVENRKTEEKLPLPEKPTFGPVCGICRQGPKYPVTTRCCGRLSCGLCVLEAIRKTGRCPFCREVFNRDEELDYFTRPLAASQPAEPNFEVVLKKMLEHLATLDESSFSTILGEMIKLRKGKSVDMLLKILSDGYADFIKKCQEKLVVIQQRIDEAAEGRKSIERGLLNQIRPNTRRNIQVEIHCPPGASSEQNDATLQEIDFMESLESGELRIFASTAADDATDRDEYLQSPVPSLISLPSRPDTPHSPDLQEPREESAAVPSGRQETRLACTFCWSEEHRARWCPFRVPGPVTYEGPLFRGEFTCRNCRCRYEAAVYASQSISCPDCATHNLPHTTRPITPEIHSVP